MDERRVSITALVTAYARVYHATHDDPKIFDDYMATQLYTEEELRFFAKNVAASLAFFAPELAAAHPDEASALAAVMRLQTAPVTLSRSRYTEDCLAQAVAEGVEQYVILGAGLDTFSFRHREMLPELQVFEVDHPITQADKRRRISEAGWQAPAGLHWIPVDFAKEQLTAALKNSVYDPHKRTFFSWLGVTFYLDHAQVLATLRAMANLAPSSSTVLFDYMDADMLVPGHASLLMQRLHALVQNVGEPTKTGFDPKLLRGELASAGLELIEDLGPDEIQARFFSGRADGYHAFEQTHFVRAVVDRTDK